MPTASREQLAALEPSATLGQGDILAQLERLDARDREARMLGLTQDVRDLTSQVRWLTIAAVVAAGAALAVAVVK